MAICRGAVAVALLAAGLAALAYLPPLDPAVTVGGPERTNLVTSFSRPLDVPKYSRSMHQFPCVDATCEAALYYPARPARIGEGLPPVVVMAHGMGGQKEFGLHAYAATFAINGIATFAFDYRGWGGSSGEPRHWLSARRHMRDWRAAIRHVRANLTDRVDISRLCLWGTSFAGGHVLIVGSEPEFRNVTAIVAQVPNLDATASTKASIKSRGVPKSLRMLAAGVLDLLRTSLGREPIYLPLAGLHGSMAFMQMTEGELERYFANKPDKPQGGWKNLARAVYAAEHAVLRTSPIKHVASVEAPVLYMGATRDTLCPMPIIERAANLTPKAELYSAECDHFELFTQPHLQALLDRQVLFLQTHTGLKAIKDDREARIQAELRVIKAEAEAKSNAEAAKAS